MLDTYFVFLRTQVMFGAISLDHEQGLIVRDQDLALEAGGKSGRVSSLSGAVGRLVEPLEMIAS